LSFVDALSLIVLVITACCWVGHSSLWRGVSRTNRSDPQELSEAV